MVGGSNADEIKLESILGEGSYGKVCVLCVLRVLCVCDVVCSSGLRR